MRRRTVAACLVGVLLLNPGCYSSWDVTGELRGQLREKKAQRREEEAQRREKEDRRREERARRRRENPTTLGQVVMAGGVIVGVLYPLGLTLTGQVAQEEKDDAYILGGSLVGLGLLLEILNVGERRRAQLLIAPNGALLTYRF